MAKKIDGAKLYDAFRQLETEAEKSAFVARLSPEENAAAAAEEQRRFSTWTKSVEARLKRIERRLDLLKGE